MQKNAWCTCKVVILLPFCRSRCRHHRRYLSPLLLLGITASLLISYPDLTLFSLSLGRGRSGYEITSLHVTARGYPDTGIRKIFVGGIRNPGLWNREFNSGICNPNNDWNMKSNFHWQGIRNPKSQIQSPNPEHSDWNSESTSCNLDFLRLSSNTLHVANRKWLTN